MDQSVSEKKGIFSFSWVLHRYMVHPDDPLRKFNTVYKTRKINFSGLTLKRPNFHVWSKKINLYILSSVQSRLKFVSRLKKFLFYIMNLLG